MPPVQQDHDRAGLLHKLGLFTAQDLLFTFPRDYQDFTDEREIDDLEEGIEVLRVDVVEGAKLLPDSAIGETDDKFAFAETEFAHHIDGEGGEFGICGGGGFAEDVRVELVE